MKNVLAKFMASALVMIFLLVASLSTRVSLCSESATWLVNQKVDHKSIRKTVFGAELSRRRLRQGITWLPPSPKPHLSRSQGVPPPPI
ncbi:hypothetical protein RND81_13G134200 [Saponaria officinalis]|uniref:Uncharacterized protein n=1 Tax=Saponaria officinalis TaxID=3572 RepID=A0AAW1GZI2_SAPOF